MIKKSNNHKHKITLESTSACKMEKDTHTLCLGQKNNSIQVCFQEMNSK